MTSLPLTPLRAEPDAYRELFPPHAAPVPPPAFALGPVTPVLRYHHYATWRPAAVGLHRLADVDVTSHGLLLRGGAFLTTDALALTPGSIAECAHYGALRADRPPTRRLARPVVPLAGPGHLIFGHWLVDFLPRLFLLERAGFDLGALTYLLPANTPDFARDLLRLAGIPDGRIETFDPYGETVRLEDALIPEYLRVASRAHPAFAEAARFLAARIGGSPGAIGRRVFLSRAAAGRDGRLLLNREEIEDAARSAGYEVLAPEALPFREQVSLFAGSARILGEYGSALHGSIFAPPAARILALRGNLPHPGFLQSGLCEALGQRIGYVFGATEETAHGQRFRVAPRDFAAALALLETDAPHGSVGLTGAFRPPGPARRLLRAARRLLGRG
ncbi:MAG: glycosyltransferase 61 family protein [Acetobacteraceae bacterium]|nr:glycosyltransferase 61 family protein [Acetobacteraceae bacterium]